MTTNPIETADVPLPAGVRRLLDQNTHPGLHLDKYVASWNRAGDDDEKLSKQVQLPAVRTVADLSGPHSPLAAEFPHWRTRRSAALAALGACSFNAHCVGPLTLHLARASALENAGICLHPVYGFVILPGSGLKGLAHAFACEVWLPTQPDRESAWQIICRVFGTAPSPWLSALARRLSVTIPTDACAGSVVFHDAWPLAWPTLVVDILNNHHSKYYQADAEKAPHTVPPPGDWEDPIPVYFLAVPGGTRFDFPLSARRPAAIPPGNCAADHIQADVTQAAEWLAGGLTHLGAGAKTASGYGAFQLDQNSASPQLFAAVPVQWHAALAAKSWLRSQTTLTLHSPAFLAGAMQQLPDCELRPATLRGELRWWWRTLHAWHVDPGTLSRLEALVWGNSENGSRVRLTLRPLNAPQLEMYRKRDYADMRPELKSSSRGIEGKAHQKTTQGLWYLSYGMDDSGRQRPVMLPGGKWELTFTVSPPTRSNPVQSELLLNEARAALFLLTRFGGVGAKARKGFGSLCAAGLEEFTTEVCQQRAVLFRAASREVNGARPEVSESSSLEQRAGEIEVLFPWGNDVWAVIDQLGFSYQQFAKQFAHQRQKFALGLPRRTDRQARDPFTPTGTLGQKHRNINDGQSVRFASPMHFHIEVNDRGVLVRATAFVQTTLPNSQSSRQILTDCLNHLGDNLKERAALPAPPMRDKPVTHDRRSNAEPNPGSHPAPQAPPNAQLRQITLDDLKKHLSSLQSPRLLLKLGAPLGNGKFRGEQYRPAPQIPAGFQPEAGWTIFAVSPGVGEGTVVEADKQPEPGKSAKFVKPFGILPPPAPPKSRSRGPQGRR